MPPEMGGHVLARQDARAVSGGLGSNEPGHISPAPTADLSTTASCANQQIRKSAGPESPTSTGFAG